MLLSLKKQTKKTQQQQTAKTNENSKTCNSPSLHHRWRCYKAIAVTDIQIGPTSLALLLP